MITSQRHTPRTGRLVQSLALAAVLAFGVAACSGGDAEPTANASSTTSDAKLALASLNAGLEAHAAGDLEAATDDYNKTLDYDPTNKFAFYNLALIDEANGNYGLAEANYRSALETDPAYEPSLFNLAILRTARNDPAEAISLYKRAVKADKKDAAAWLNLGLLLRDNGQVLAGDRDVLRALALDSSLQDPARGEDGSSSTVVPSTPSP